MKQLEGNNAPSMSKCSRLENLAVLYGLLCVDQTGLVKVQVPLPTELQSCEGATSEVSLYSLSAL